MSTIVTRAGKGSPLTNTEVDSNFINLNTDKIESITSADGSVVVTPTGTARDLSVAISGSTTNVVVLVRNTTGATLTKGTAVYISGATGQNPTVSKALATSDATSAQTLGLMSADLADNTNGYVTVIGLITNINTSAYTDGAQLYLSGVTAGTLTATKPYAPIHLVYAAVVEHAHATQGKLFVKVQNGYELDEIHDVSAQSPTNGQTIVFNSSNSLWEKNTVSLTAGVNGVLPTANGGTGLSSFTSGGVVYASSTSALATGSALQFDGSKLLVGTFGNTGRGLEIYGGNALFDGNGQFDLLIGDGGFAYMSLRTADNAASLKIRNHTGSTDIITFERTSGNVLIGGTTNSLSARLLSENASGNQLALVYTGVATYVNSVDASGNLIWLSSSTERMRIDSSGNVGIGTSSPASKLHIVDALSGGQLLVASSETNATGKFGTFATQHYTNAEEPALAIAVQSNATDNFVNIGGALSEFNSATHIRFYTAANNTTVTGSERMRIDNAGNVGIGISSLAYKLESYAVGQSDIAISSGLYTNGAVAGQLLFRNYQAAGWTGTRDMASISYAGTAADHRYANIIFSLKKGAADASMTEVMRIDQSGNFGFGTTTITIPSGFSRWLAIGDSDTGIGQISDGVLALATNNVERLRIDATGNLSLGATSANGMRLNVQGYSPELYDPTIASAKFAYLPKGSQELFEINLGATLKAGYANLINISVNDNNGGDGVYYGAVGQSSANAGANFVFGRRTGATSWAESLRIDSAGTLLVGMTTDSGVGVALFPTGITRKNTNGTVFDQYRYAGASVGTTTTDGANIQYNAASSLVFGTGGSTERARIDSSGNLLVGTTSAAGKLTVVGANTSDGPTAKYIANIRNSGAQTSGVGAGIAFTQTMSSFNATLATIQGIKENATSDNYASALSFYTRANGADLTERARIDSSGNLLVGTTTSAGKLTVAGSGAASNTLTLNGTTTGANYARLTSTGADGVLGIEGSGGSVIMSGSSAYATVLYSVNATPLQLGTNSITRATFDVNGNFAVGTTDMYGRINAQRYTGAPFSTIALGDFVTASNSVGIYGRVTSSGLFGISTAGSPIVFYQGGPAITESARFDTSGNLLIGTTTNTNTSKLVVNGTISQTVGGTQYLVVDQSDIGTGANEIPLNQYLGSMAYQDGSAYYNTGMTVGFRNRIINGAMGIDQRNAGATVNQINGAFNLDRWSGNSYNGGAATGKFSVGQSGTAPTGFSNSLLVTSLSASATTTSDIYNIEQKIEGFNFADFMYGTANAQTLTLSFWVRSSITGTFGGALKNSARNRAYPFTYTINSANAWEQKTLVIGGDTSGTWVGSTNGVGLWVSFGLGVGTSFTEPSGLWGGGDQFSADGCVSLISTNGATWYITGVQLEKGNIATSFDVRPYGTELALCQRYYQQWGGNSVNERLSVGFNYSTTQARTIVPLIVTMRSTPTLTVSAAADWAIEGFSTFVACTSVSLDQPSPRVAAINFNVASGLTAGQGVQVAASSNINSRLNLSAEL